MNILEKIKKERLIAENILNGVYNQLHQRHISSEHRKFLLLKVQAAIVQFEICSGLLQLVMSQENCFARKVILKGLIHIIFEYKKTLKNHHIKTLMDLCESKNFASEKEELSRLTKEYKKALKQIDRFLDLRDQSTGHYDPDTAKQVSLIESIDENDSLKMLIQFSLFNKGILESLSRVGRKQ